VQIHNHVHRRTTRDVSPVVVVLAEARQRDRMGYMCGLRRLALVPDSTKWHSNYDATDDTVTLERKFFGQAFDRQIETLLHEAGHRGQTVDRESYELFKRDGLNTRENFLAMANKAHRDDYHRHGIRDLAEEAFAESYGRFCVGWGMPPRVAAFWVSRVLASSPTRDDVNEKMESVLRLYKRPGTTGERTAALAAMRRLLPQINDRWLQEEVLRELSRTWTR